jgi:histone H3/H4
MEELHMSGETLIVASKAKAAISAKGCNSGGDAVDGLNAWVHWLIEQATARAKANGRKTVRAHDFIIT